MRPKKDFPPEDARQVFWLVPNAMPSRPQRPVAKSIASVLELTAAGTAAEFHGIPI
jgi:hypothetical protein